MPWLLSIADSSVNLKVQDICKRIFFSFRLDEIVSYQRITYPILIHFPIAAVILLSCAIIMALNRKGEFGGKSGDRRNKEKKAAKQLALIVGCFLLGYLPYTGTVLKSQRNQIPTVALRHKFWSL